MCVHNISAELDGEINVMQVSFKMRWEAAKFSQVKFFYKKWEMSDDNTVIKGPVLANALQH